MDGTFKSAPQNFTQLYTIHATYRGHVIPVIYCLLSDKTSDTYHLIFDIIKRKMAALDVTFNPSTIISDFESSIIPTLRHHFPNTQHHGCYFHHTQAIWRQVQRLGLQAEYEEDQFIRRSARSLMALAFLPEDKITPTWMTGPFPMDMWNVHQATTRTNNMVEGWHSKLNKYVRRLHPNVHQLIKELQKEQAMTQLTLQRARLRGAPPARRQKYVRIDQQVDTMTTNYTENRLTELEYLAGLRRVIHHY